MALRDAQLNGSTRQYVLLKYTTAFDTGTIAPLAGQKAGALRVDTLGSYIGKLTAAGCEQKRCDLH